MISPLHWILVYYREKERFCWKVLVHHCSLHWYEYFTQKFFVPICTQSLEFDISIGRKFTADPVQNLFWNHILAIHSSVHCASFDTFWAPIAQIFETQWIFKYSRKFRMSPFLNENVTEDDFLRILKDFLCL